MGFLRTAVIVVAMGLISFSAGALGYLLMRLSLEVAGILALAVFAVLLVWQFTRWRADDAAKADRGLTDLSHSVERLSRDLALVANRLSTLESAGAATAARDISAIRADVARMDERISDVSEIVARQGESMLTIARTASQPHIPSQAPDPVRDNVPLLDPVASAMNGARRTGRFASLPTGELVAVVAQALQAGRLEIMLQPMVTLPQRKIRFYELTANLKTERGEVLLPEDYRAALDQGGLGAAFDSDILFRAVQILRRLQARNRDVGLSLNLTTSTLTTGDKFREFVDFIEANAAIASSLVFEVPQSAYREFSVLEFEGLSAITRFGAKVGLDQVRDLRFDAKDLADRAFRFVKVPAYVILGRAGTLPSDIHPADLADLLARYGVDLVATGVDTEAIVVDLLDFDVRFGQGMLFSPPRPVRADLVGDLVSERRAAAS
jgi:cyclic-di-GMP phosphodiesterase TipF (flagellum assembly factor)